MHIVYYLFWDFLNSIINIKEYKNIVVNIYKYNYTIISCRKREIRDLLQSYTIILKYNIAMFFSPTHLDFVEKWDLRHPSSNLGMWVMFSIEN